MPVELRKRKAREPVPAPPPSKKKATPKTAKAASATENSNGKEPAKPKGRPPKAAAAVNGSAKAAPAAAVAIGDSITLDGFGGEVETHDGVKTNLKALVDESKAGVVLFTYPKASTPGCTTQACLFRDSYEPLTAGGLLIYGLSADTPKENTKFKEKQKLPYPLLCDPKATLLEAIGLKKGAGKATRGVFVVDKSGKVLAAQPGSPAVTLEVVKKIVAETDGAADANEAVKADEAPAVEDGDKADQKDE